MISLSQRRLKTEAQALVRAINKQERADKRSSLPEVKRVVPARDGKQRQPRERDRGYLGFIGELFCIATKVRAGAEVYGVERCHVRFSLHEAGMVNPGKSNKPDDFRTVPLLPAEHHRQHMRGDEEAFWDELHVKPYDLIADLRAAYPDREAAKQVLRDHAMRARSAAISTRKSADRRSA